MMPSPKHARKLEALIKARLLEKSPRIQVILGPRQVGKTTALKSAMSGRGIYQSADLPSSLGTGILEEWWNEALRTDAKILGIDEIQKIALWSEAIKKLWDQTSRPKLKLILTGSSSLFVEKGLKETLAGRFELIRVEHWNFNEARTSFGVDLKSFIEFGCYPGSMEFLKTRDRWANFVRDSIVEPAIGRDLLQLHPIDQPALLRQVFGVAVANPAQIVSLQKLQGQLQGRGTLPTIQNYLRLLEEGFLVTGIEKYSAASLRAKRSTPKLIIHDNALIRAFERPVSAPLLSERFGRYFENCVGARFLEAGWDVFYWRDRDLEVDYVVRGPNGERWAIEVKVGRPNEEDLRGLRVFCKRYPDFQPRLVSLQEHKLSSIQSLDIEKILSLHRIYE